MWEGLRGWPAKRESTVSKLPEPSPATATERRGGGGPELLATG